MKWLWGLLGVLCLSCSKLDRIDPENIEVNIKADSIVFAQIGDFGYAGMPAYNVSKLVKSWKPDFIISSGDNNYSEGKLETIVNNITQFYGDYIYNFDAPSDYRCNGIAFQDKVNRFFPTPGNHDANNKDNLTPYYNFFTLPGNESYYSFIWGPVTFYSINSADENIDAEKAWLVNQVKLSSSPFKIIFFHHPSYSQGGHGSNTFMQWDFYSMGIDVILTGHDHIYNRIEKTGEESLHYIVNGLSGKGTSKGIVPGNLGSQFKSFCYGEDFGAIKAIATTTKLIIEFYSVSNPESPIDRFVIAK